MVKASRLGIWMDHSIARLMEFTTDPVATITIESAFTHEEKQHTLNKGQKTAHHKEQHLQSEYYKRIGDAIKKYKEVILFGPTTAKVELFNFLKKDHHFDKIKIETDQADKMTENQQHAFIRDYFARH